MSSERVTVREYPTAEDAKAAEELLLGSGLTSDIVSRSGKKIRVVANWEADAIAVLEGTMTTVNVTGGPTMAPVATDYYTEEGSTGVTDKAKDAASTAASTVTGAASSAAGTVTSAASSATDTVSSAASTATDTVAQAASTAAEKVQGATSGVTTQIDQATNALADKIETAAATIQEKGASPDAPAAQRAVAQTTANVLDKTAQYIEHPSGSVILNDLRGAVRRHPLRSLLVGLGLGFLARSTVLSGVGSATGQLSGQSSTTTATTPETTSYSSSADLGYGTASTTTVTDADAFTMDSGVVAGDATMTDASTLYSDPIADDMIVGAADTAAMGEDVLVVDVDPVTGEASSVTSTTLDSPEALGTDEDPLYPRSGS